jgi:threonine/homoserine/homoserine lactone efflux protein
MHDMGRQDRDPRSAGGVARTIEVVPDRPVVDDEDRPDVVRVGWVGVRRERGVEDLTHPGERRLPGADDPVLGRDVHRRIVQDGGAEPPYRRLVDGIPALVAFSFVSSVTPGPNNVLLWASGAEFGLRATFRHIAGTALGIGAMALAVGAGLGALIASVPEVAFVMRVAGSLYLLFLAYQIAGAHGLARGELARPLGIRQAAALQLINPKAWIFALGAVTTFRPAALPPATGSLAVAATMMIVIVPTAALWAGAGGVLGRLLTDERRRRAMSLILAALVVATVASVWV